MIVENYSLVTLDHNIPFGDHTPLMLDVQHHPNLTSLNLMVIVSNT